MGRITDKILFPSIQNNDIWCSERDLNPHVSRHYPLKIACLPIPPPEHIIKLSVRSKTHSVLTTRYAWSFSGLLPFTTLMLPAYRLPIPPPEHIIKLSVRSKTHSVLTTRYAWSFSGFLPFTTLMLPAYRLPTPAPEQN